MRELTLTEEQRLVLLFAIESLGGAGTKANVLDWIDRERVHIVAESENRVVTNGEAAWRNTLAWNRDALVKRGAIANITRNDWQSTEAGRAYLADLASRLSEPQRLEYINPELIDRILNVGLAISPSFPWIGETEFIEGSSSHVWTVRYERNSQLRDAAISIHGHSCQGCGFDFEGKYGALGIGFIEVHHTKPVSSVQGTALVSAESDMAVLCSNCHRMVHRRRGNPLTVDELRKAINQAA